jgi:4a-hydroxytetrahydrobiopterin dehydratase
MRSLKDGSGRLASASLLQAYCRCRHLGRGGSTLASGRATHALNILLPQGPCNVNAKPDEVLSAEMVAKRLKGELPHWQVKDGHVCRVFRTGGWKGTLMVVNTVGHLAEAAWHHPDLLVSYASVEVRLMTHSAKGITEKDLALARKIEDVVQWQPGKEAGSLEGTPQEPRFQYVVYD